MQIKILFIFSLISITLYNKPLSKLEAVNHFYQNLERIVKDKIKYTISEQSKKFEDKFTMLLYNHDTFAASIKFYFKKDNRSYQNEKGIFEIKGVHNSTIIKEINNYYEQELDLQWDLLPELIKRIGELELDEDGNEITKPFYLNMIEDIRQELQKNNEKNGIEFNVQFEDEDYQFLDGSQSTAKVTRMTLNSRESIIANIDVVIDKKIDEKRSSNFQKTQYYLVVSAVTANNSQQAINMKIPMISRDYSDFQQYLEQLNDLINLKNYSNNNKEHYLNLQYYMRQKLDDIKFIEKSDLDKNFDKIIFDMNFENSQANGELTYIKPTNDNKIGSYNLKIWKDQKLEKDIDFNRMENKELQNLFFAKKVHNIFQSIYDFIMEIFIEKHKEIIEPQYPDWTIKDYHVKGGFLSSAQYGLHHKKKFIFTCDTTGSQVYIKYEAPNVKGFQIEHTFPKIDFNQQVEEVFIDYILRGHLEFLNTGKVMI